MTFNDLKVVVAFLLKFNIWTRCSAIERPRCRVHYSVDQK